MNKKPTIIFLNGVGSAGKTSIAQALQEMLDEPYLHIGNDHFFEMLPKKYQPGGVKAKDGVDFITKKTEKGSITKVHCGEAGKKLFSSMKKAILQLAKGGFNLIIDRKKDAAHAPFFRYGVSCAK